MKTFKSILITIACFLLISCSDSSSSYDVFPMLVYTVEIDDDFVRSAIQMLDSDGSLTPINTPKDISTNDVYSVSCSSFSAEGAAIIKYVFDIYRSAADRYYIVYRDNSEPLSIKSLLSDSCRIESCRSFSEGVAILTYHDYTGEKGDMAVAINTKGKIMWEKELKGKNYIDNPWTPFINGKAFSDENRIINKDCELVEDFLEKEYKPCIPGGVSDGLRESLRYKVLSTGCTRLEHYRNVTHYGVMDFKGNCIIKPIYDEPIIVESEDRFVVKHDGEGWGVVNRSGDIILPFEYDRLAVDGDMFLCRKDGKYTWIDDKGNVLITPPESFRTQRGNLSNYYGTCKFNGTDYAIDYSGMVINKQGKPAFNDGMKFKCYFKSGDKYFFIGSHYDSQLGTVVYYIRDETGKMIYGADKKTKIIWCISSMSTFIRDEADVWDMNI